MLPNRDGLTKIKTTEDLAAFVSELYNDLQENPDKWENITLETYLEAMSRWLETGLAEHWLTLDSPETTAQSLQAVANVLMAARIYE